MEVFVLNEYSSDLRVQRRLKPADIWISMYNNDSYSSNILTRFISQDQPASWWSELNGIRPGESISLF